MLSSILIILASTGAALLFLLAVTRIWPHHARKESNDFTGAVVAVIGTTYAVILAFTLSGVWNNFQEAQANEEQEANALTNVYRIATTLQDPNARRIQELCARYADNALHHEWPEMKNDQMPPEADEITDQLWQLAGQTQAHAAPDAIAAYQLMEELRGLTQYRRLRIMQARERLPVLLWVGADRRRRHHRGRRLLLRRIQLPLSPAAGADAQLPDLAGAVRHRRHRPPLPGNGDGRAAGLRIRRSEAAAEPGAMK